MFYKQKVQRNIYIINHAALLLGVILIYNQLGIESSVPFSLLSVLFTPFSLPYLILHLSIPLFFEIASHALYGLAHRPPFPYSLFVISKIFLCIALVSYLIVVFVFFTLGGSNTFASIGMGIYPALSLVVLFFPYTTHQRSGQKPEK